MGSGGLLHKNGGHGRAADFSVCSGRNGSIRVCRQGFVGTMVLIVSYEDTKTDRLLWKAESIHRTTILFILIRSASWRGPRSLLPFRHTNCPNLSFSGGRSLTVVFQNTQRSQLASVRKHTHPQLVSVTSLQRTHKKSWTYMYYAAVPASRPLTPARAGSPAGLAASCF